MSPTKPIYMGIDPSGGITPFAYAGLDGDCQLVMQGAGDADLVFRMLSDQDNIVVAINAPRNTNTGLVRGIFEKQNPSLGHMRGADMRLAEYELRQRGIHISPTPSRPTSCASWVQVCFDFYRKLEGIGFKYFSAEGGNRQFLETHPHATYCALLGQVPLPKPTLEGRLQRQVVLYEHSVGIKDPMEFFEEITRHRLLKGSLPYELIYNSEELDAMAAAFTAYLALTRPSQVMGVGDKQEGQILLPVSSLKESYI